jgi:2,3-bisphosphoglycerate-independent phosphoglycerate mutase
MPGKIYVVALCGVADDPGPGPTPLEWADTPHLDSMAARGVTGLLDVVGDGIPPESDSGAMALLGYDPLVSYTGRGPLEGLGADFLNAQAPGSTAVFRLNVASHDRIHDRLDRRTARDLSDSELADLLQEVRADVSLADHEATFDILGFGRHRGVVAFHSRTRPLSGNVTNTDPQYTRRGPFGVPRDVPLAHACDCAPLDDSPGSHNTAGLVTAFSARSAEVMAGSAVNRRRQAEGRIPANAFLLRDGGDRLPKLRSFREVSGRSLAIFGQIPAERGLALLMKGAWRECRRPGDEPESRYYQRLVDEIVAVPEDTVYVHVKAADEAAHDGDMNGKVAAIERVDALFIQRLHEQLGPGDICVLTGDHATPWRSRIHSADPVPIAVTGTARQPDAVRVFSERAAADGALGRGRARDMLTALS